MPNSFLVQGIGPIQISGTVFLHSGLGIPKEGGLVHPEPVHNLSLGAQTQTQARDEEDAAHCYWFLSFWDMESCVTTLVSSLSMMMGFII
jgi:hypothetical protein